MTRRRWAAAALFVSVIGGALVVRNQIVQRASHKPYNKPPRSTCLASNFPKLESRVTLEAPFEPLRFVKATGAYQSPVDPKRWYVLEKDGRVLTFLEGDAFASVYLDLREYGIRAVETEAGLLSMAFHPDFPENGRIFFSYTTADAPLEMHVAEFHGSLDGKFGLGPPREILQPIPQWFKNHMITDVKFGHDGFLYIAIGDGRTPGDLYERAQDTRVLQGKILRIDVDGKSPGKNYGIPADNPFADGKWGAPEVFAYGFRNTWRMGFDSVTGELWGGDVGQYDWEELNHIVKGGNYGWSQKQGTHCFKAKESCFSPEWIEPVAEHSHKQDAIAIVAGFPYRGRAFPELYGATIYGDHGTGRIFAVREGGKPELLISSGPSISSFAEDRDGEIYVVGYGESVYFAGGSAGGRIYKLAPSQQTGGGSAPVSLSGTGCVDPAKPTEAATGLIPYEVGSPQSTGASTRRWLSLPPKGKIAIGPDGDWEIPAGAVLVQELALDGRRVETRLLVHQDDGEWSGYSYEWDDAQKDATLVLDGKQRIAGGKSFTIPSRSQCLECHSRAAGTTLGLETAQMNRDFPDGAGAAYSGNQIELLRARKAFVADPGKAKTLPVHEAGTGTIGDRARAFLATNCSPCHRPGGRAPTEMDLRAETPFGSMNICNTEPTQGDLGFTGAKIVTPGNAKASILAIRPTRPEGQGRMPPFEMSAEDPEEGAKLIAGWIDSLKSCN